MDRAELRRLKLKSLEFREPGMHFRGNCLQAYDILQHWREYPTQVTDFPGVRRPAAAIRKEPVSEGNTEGADIEKFLNKRSPH